MPLWSVQLEGGPRRVNHAAVSVHDKIYSFGGYCTGTEYDVHTPMDVHMLCTITYRWRALPVPTEDDPQYVETPFQRYGHTAVVYEDCAYIWGGRNDFDGTCNTLFAFDTVTLKWSCVSVNGEVPGARDGHAACMINKKMYMFGGYEDEVAKFSNQIHAFDFLTKTWSLIRSTGSPAQWRDFHSATALGSCMYVFGGRGDLTGPYHTRQELYYHRVQQFDTRTNAWSEPDAVGQMPVGRRSHSAFAYEGELYIFGGYNGNHEVHFGDIYKYNPVSNVWSVVKTDGQGPCPRRRQCCCLVASRLFLFGGTSPGITQNPSEVLVDHSDLHVLDFAPSLKTLCLLYVLKHDIDRSSLSRDIRWELTAMSTNSNISRALDVAG